MGGWDVENREVRLEIPYLESHGLLLHHFLSKFMPMTFTIFICEMGLAITLPL